MQVGGDINLSNTKLTKLPKDIKIKGRIILDESGRNKRLRKFIINELPLFISKLTIL